MKTSIWNPASKVLNFDAIESGMLVKGILYDFGFQEDYREIYFPVDKNFLFGEIVLVEFYTEHIGYYFFYWRDNTSKTIKDMPEGFIYKIDAKRGVIVEEGRGLTSFKDHLTNEYLAEKGVAIKNYEYVRENLPLFFENLLNTIDYTIKNTIRSNAELFLDSL